MRKKLKPKMGKAILWAIKVDGTVQAYRSTEKAANQYAFEFAEHVTHQDNPWHPRIEVVEALIADEFCE